MKILHITAHLGGGIGRAYSGITRESERFGCSHEIILLERAEKSFFVERVKENGCAVYVEPSLQEIAKIMRNADIVQINWWHHPLMAKFLYEFPNVPVRLVGWVHVSGCTYPHLRADFLRKFEQIFFTTSYSYENAEVADWVNGDGKNKTSIIYGMGDASRFFNITKEPHSGFRIGYLGTLEFSKLHPAFVEYCASAAKVADDIKFVMIGDNSNKEKILNQADQYNIADRFEFRGFCEDVGEELSRLDCVGYLLNPYHFGATENVILETMAAGVPVILMNQNTEKYIVENNKSGFLIYNSDEYRAVVELLYRDQNERNRIAQNARDRIKTNYSIEANTKKLYSFYDNITQCDKRIVTFCDIFGESPSDWFLYFVGQERAIFNEKFHENKLDKLPEIFKGESKSSIKHFAKYFTEDEKLMTWLGCLDTLSNGLTNYRMMK
ncbi:MAG: glycosyltransferase family 4 protein [Planctomycetaceae bacterium]|jgi:glycosyltransferase involved in cell wall biosynthesis|nr:glycosyltransferase family 4 protein [Planctomycetaceae bacterium]